MSPLSLNSKSKISLWSLRRFRKRRARVSDSSKSGTSSSAKRRGLSSSRSEIEL